MRTAVTISTEEKRRMNLSEMIRAGAERLKNADIDDSDFDARQLAQHVLSPLYPNGFDAKSLILFQDMTVDNGYAEKYFDVVNERANNKPLQYILGDWDFMGLTFNVGEGVLIPRPETETLAEIALDFLKGKENPIVFDLCSGSGCIAICIAKLCPSANVYAVEKSDIAFGYLNENISLNKADNVHAVKGDIFDKNVLSGIVPDLIVSNPPYIRSDDIGSLQTEVQREPAMALDGGEDGYDFYRVIASDWIKSIKKGGMIAVECAEDQTEYIEKLFSKTASEVKAYNDLFGLPRGVTAII
ncbi:MAG TPA: peptide chain release factor N(5)-glutamine methyltransferase [Ruminococcaceae bacterium]|nr:peptide chain release factor N(5)-glutamine methyltransferase [Oscillospiraceae bacterium]